MELYHIYRLENLPLDSNTNDKCTHVSGCPQDAFLHLAHSDPQAPDHRRNHSYDSGFRQLSDPYTSDRRHLESHDRRLCQLQPDMDDVAYLRNRPSPSYSNDGHVVECPLTRHSTGHDLCSQRAFDPVDSLIHGCPSCWREYGRDYIPNFYSRPSWEHLELPALIRQARDLETAQKILRSNLNACLRNRELRPRDIDELLYPIRNRNGDYPHGFDEPRSIRWLRRELDRK